MMVEVGFAESGSPKTGIRVDNGEWLCWNKMPDAGDNADAEAET